MNEISTGILIFKEDKGGKLPSVPQQSENKPRI